MYDLSKVVVTSSPHIKAADDTRSMMLDVLIALIPALVRCGDIPLARAPWC